MTLANKIEFRPDFGNPPYNQLTFDYFKVPQKYRVGDSEDTVVVFRGDVAGLHSQGILSRALRHNEPETISEAKRIVEEGNVQDISGLIHRHIAMEMKGISPFVSTSYNPEMAQYFAPTRFDVHSQPKRTIYKIQISIDRAIIDADNIGKSGKCGEILVLGLIYPFEIKAFKRFNDDLSSELLNGRLLGFRPLESGNRQ